MKAAAGHFRLVTSLLVIAEIVWTLQSFYGLDKREVVSKIEFILNTPNLECPDWGILIQALDLYFIKNIDFIDAYHAVSLREHNLTKIATFDFKHFKRIDWLEIVEL